MHNLKKSRSQYKDISYHQHKHRIMINAGLVSFTLPKNGLATCISQGKKQCTLGIYIMFAILVCTMQYHHLNKG